VTSPDHLLFVLFDKIEFEHLAQLPILLFFVITPFLPMVFVIFGTSVLQGFPCRLFVFQPHSEQGFQAVVQQGAMLLHGKMA